MSERPLYDELWNYAKPKETAVSFQTLLPTLDPAQERDAYLQLLTQLARTHSLRRQFDQAHKLLDDVETQLDDDVPIARVRYLLERGRTYNSSKQQPKARPLFVEAYELSKQIGADFYAVDAAHMMGIAGESVDEQMEWNLTAVSLAEQSENQYAQRWLGSLLNNIGWTHHDAGEYGLALEMFERCERFFVQRQPNEGRARIARWCIARTLRSLGEVEEALAMQLAQQAEYAALGEEDGYVQEELGECLLLLGQKTAASPHFAAAHRILSQDQWLQANEPERLARLKALA